MAKHNRDLKRERTWRRHIAEQRAIGSLKARTNAAATRHGRPGTWTWDDAAAAVVEANLFAWPRGEQGPSPEQLWTNRTKTDAMERTRFAACVGQHLEASKPAAGSCSAEEPEVQSMRGVARQAIRLALEECGYLTYTRRRIPPPIPRRKVDIIP